MGNSNSSQQLEEVAPANDTTNASAKATPIKHAPIASSQPIALPGSSNKNAAAMAKARLLIPESLVAGSPLVSEEGQSLGSGGRGHFRQRSTSSAGTPGASNTAGSALGQQMHGLALSNAPIQEVVSPGRVGKTAVS